VDRLTIKKHKNLKGLESQNLRDHMSEAELIFTALAELSTRQIAEVEKAKGIQQNAIAGKKGEKIAKDARYALEQKIGQKVITPENFLPPITEIKKLHKKSRCKSNPPSKQRKKGNQLGFEIKRRIF